VIGLAEPDNSFDSGAATTFKDSTLRGAFKVPSLRNAALTAPYSHSGRFEKLEDMISFYTKGRGHEVPESEALRIHWHIWEPGLRNEEVDRLVDFIKTLSDESFKPKVPEILPSGIRLRKDTSTVLLYPIQKLNRTS
jgi:cytochrome c peroxidase